MPLAFFFDQHASAAIARGLRLRRVEVLTAFEDGADRFADEKLLLRATTLGRVLFTQDEDLLALAHQYQAEGKHFAGVVYAHQMRVFSRALCQRSGIYREGIFGGRNGRAR